jgi:hypothetical protein
MTLKLASVILYLMNNGDIEVHGRYDTIAGCELVKKEVDKSLSFGTGLYAICVPQYWAVGE